mmetsp:Transcript_35867/g.83465  ORF Transcript_35867/g.83465 Transcript_35867/m.83465 type:complete len:246 (-) Transcript_35867:594-1331(-)
MKRLYKNAPHRKSLSPLSFRQPSVPVVDTVWVMAVCDHRPPASDGSLDRPFAGQTHSKGRPTLHWCRACPREQGHACLPNDLLLGDQPSRRCRRLARFPRAYTMGAVFRELCWHPVGAVKLALDLVEVVPMVAYLLAVSKAEPAELMPADTPHVVAGAWVLHAAVPALRAALQAQLLDELLLFCGLSFVGREGLLIVDRMLLRLPACLRCNAGLGSRAGARFLRRAGWRWLHAHLLPRLPPLPLG